jgi:putative iron-dependent peroxidase
MVSPEPQPVLTPITESAIFLILTVDAGGEDVVRDLLSDAAGLRRSVGFRLPEGGLTCVVGLGSDLWDRLFAGPRPAQLHPFREMVGAQHTAPSTPGDLLFHIRARRFDLCFELAQRLMERLSGVARVVDEVHGFRSFDERDLLGFVDGTENPEGNGAVAAAIVGDEDPAFAGGAYVMLQKYVHDLPGWDRLAIEEQELAMGRTKLSDIELSDEAKPSNAHVALTSITGPDGEERQIVRYNMPFGRVGSSEYGTYFIGYARTPDVLEEMLENMVVGRPPGTHDRILDFSTPLTGNLFFVPSAAFLEDPPPAAATPAAAPADAPAEAADDPAAAPGSLGIGSLRRA